MYYGWKIVGVTSISHSISVGFVFYSYGVFLKALAAEFGGGRLSVSFGLTAMHIAIGILSPFLGHALDHRSIRKIMCLGAVFMSLGFFFAAQITALWQFYVILGVFLGMGGAMMGGLPGSKLVVNWFVKRRGMALGITTMGVSMSGVIMAPVATQLIGAIGWRNTFMIYGALIFVVVVPLAWWFIVNRPEDMGLFPDGASTPPLEPDLVSPPVETLAPGEELMEQSSPTEWSTRDTLRDRNFWIIALLFSCIFFSMSATLTHLIPHTTDLGFSPEKAAFVISATAGMAVAGKFVFGFIADHVDSRLALWISIAFQVAGTFMFPTALTYPVLLLAGGLFGFGMGGIAPLWRLLVGEVFGRRSFGRVMGLMNPCMLPIRAAGVPFAGYVFDQMGNYTIAFRTFLGLYFVAACMVFLLPVEKVNSQQAMTERPGEA